MRSSSRAASRSVSSLIRARSISTWVSCCHDGRCSLIGECPFWRFSRPFAAVEPRAVALPRLPLVTSAAAVADQIESELAPLHTDVSRAWWDLNVARERRERAPAGRARDGALRLPRRCRPVRGDRGGARGRPKGSYRRRLDLLRDAFLPQQIPAELAHADHRARGVRRDALLAAPRRDRRAAASTTTRSSGSCARATTPAERRAAWEASKTVGALVADDVRELARLRNAAAHVARLPRLVRALGRDVGDGRGAADRHARRGRRGDGRAVRALEGRARRAPRRPVRLRRRRAARRGTTPTRSSRRCRPRAASTSTTCFDGRRPRRARTAHLRRDRARHARRCSTAATCSRATASASTRSASTSTARATSACSRTSSRTSTGWTRCCTSSATRRSTPGFDRSLPWLLRDSHLVVTEGIAILMGRLASDAEWLERVRRRRCRPRWPGSPDELRGCPGRRAARLHPLGARDDELRALRSTPTPSPTSTPAGGSSSSATSSSRRPTAGAARTGPRRSTSPARPSTTTRTSTGSIVASQLAATLERECGGLVGRPEAGRLLGERRVRAGAVGALGQADRAGDRRAADGGAFRARHRSRLTAARSAYLCP